MIDISIHALLAESDNNINSSVNTADQISIHALLAESDLLPTRKTPRNWHFYPRSPCGERRRYGCRSAEVSDFYPRSPCGERRTLWQPRIRPLEISIHALLAESDRRSQGSILTHKKFLSTLSLRRATVKDDLYTITGGISIHALLAESDPPTRSLSMLLAAFLSTLSLRRATTRSKPISFATRISIHALLAESDRIVLYVNGGRSVISIHALLAESDRWLRKMYFLSIRFLSTLSLRRATLSLTIWDLWHHHFYPRSPCGERR